MSSSGPPCSRQPKSQRTNSKQNDEVSYLGNAKFPSEEQGMQPEERSPSAYHAPLDESSDSTRVSTKRRHDKRSQLLDAIFARLGPHVPSMRGKPHVVML